MAVSHSPLDSSPKPASKMEHTNGEPARPRTSEGAAVRYQNACYYYSSSIYKNLSPTLLDPDQITILYYASASIARDGTVHLGDISADTRLSVDGYEGCLRACLALKEKNPALKVLLSIGGDEAGRAFSSIAGHHDSAETFARSAKSLVDQYGLDGIDVCWRHPRNSREAEDMARLLSRTRRQLSRGDLLTAALPGNTWDLRKIPDLPQLGRIVDYFNLFSMDFGGSWSPETRHQSQLYPQHSNFFQEPSCHSIIKFLIPQLVPANKILLGIPTYGRSFLGATHIEQRFSGSGGVDGVFEYKELPRPEAFENFDMESHAAFSVGGDGGFVSYDNPTSVCSKARYVTHNGLAGLFYSNAMSDAPGDRSLIKAGFFCLYNPP